MLHPTNYIISLFLGRTIFKTRYPLTTLLALMISVSSWYMIVIFWEIDNAIEFYGFNLMWFQMAVVTGVSWIAILLFSKFLLGNRRILDLNIQHDNDYFMGSRYNAIVLGTLLFDFAGYILYELFSVPNQYWEFLPAGMCLISDVFGFAAVWLAGPVKRAGNKDLQMLTEAGFRGIFLVSGGLNVAVLVALAFRGIGPPFSFIPVGGDFVTQMVALGFMIGVHAIHVIYGGVWYWKTQHEKRELAEGKGNV